jgi:hypothetical protein
MRPELTRYAPPNPNIVALGAIMDMMRHQMRRLPHAACAHASIARSIDTFTRECIAIKAGLTIEGRDQ